MEHIGISVHTQACGLGIGKVGSERGFLGLHGWDAGWPLEDKPTK